LRKGIICRFFKAAEHFLIGNAFFGGPICKWNFHSERFFCALG